LTEERDIIMPIDLHAHSTHSDGELTPRELMEAAAAIGLSAIALTDHDILSGLDEAAARARELGLRFIPGVELEINFPEGEFHLLGLGLTGERSVLEAKLIEVRAHRASRNERIVGKMNAAGLPVTMADIAALAHGEVISRLHFATYLLKQGLVSSIPEAFSRFLGKGGSYFDPKKALDLEEAVACIHRAGGRAFIAHPLSLKLPWERLTAYLVSACELGLDGVEAYHSDYPPADCRKLEAFAREWGLFVSAGSDFHGRHVPGRRLGKSSGGMDIGAEFLSWLS
jgi:predicted metal-dependent phosphoesterase TrpH